MLRSILGLGAVLMAASAMAAPAEAPHQAVIDRFTPFDQAAGGDGWEALSPDPIFASVAVGTPEGAPLTLKPGAYRIVVLCACAKMEVTLLRPDSSPIAAERSDDHGAMYSLDVPAAGAYLTGIDMDDCPRAKCEVGVKVYRRKDG